MLLPPRDVAAGSTTAPFNTTTNAYSPTSSLPDYDSEQWSSLIGIVTAIVGNILISFALNIQRYAHIRLDREWQEKETRRKKRSAEYRSGRASAAEATGRSKKAGTYHPPRHAEYTVENEREQVDAGAVATEADPLLPSVLPSRHKKHEQGRSRSRSKSKTSRTQVDEDDDEEAYKQQSYLKSPWWWGGIILMTTGEAGNFLAYGFAPASIVSPLGVVALISNCIIAPIMLKERFRTRDGLGVLVAVAGAVTIVMSASDNNPKLGPDEIWDLISTWEFETYFGITVGVIVALTVASNRYGSRSILIDLGLVGLFGGYTALSTKGVASMLSYTLWRAITFPITYLLVAILVFTAVMQIKYVNRALQRFDATQVIPVQFVLFTLSVILGSAVLYRDFERTSGEEAGKFVGGCALTFLGVWLITSGRHGSRDTDEEDREPEGEESIGLINGERYHDDLDGTDDESIAASSRRSSTIRATSPPMAIDQRRPSITIRDTSSPSAPSKRPSTAEASPLRHEIFNPPSPSPLSSNPWEQDEYIQQDVPFVRPPSAPLSRHSTPLLPSEATVTPTLASSSSPDLPTKPPRTPIRGISENNVASPTPGTATTPTTHRLRRIGTAERLGARNSVTGPLIASPLSTSLSAMVADLKRGGSLRGPHPQRELAGADASQLTRRRESVLGIGAQEVDERDMRQGWEPLDRRRTATDDVPSRVGNESRGEGGVAEGEREGRKRSFSGAVGEFWGRVRGGGKIGARTDEDRGGSGRGARNGEREVRSAV
ncbi:DUF803-domain-containing protein [Lophiostoma macrostomum CBS 122681]|uniref:DUF803-domain-containing protein n=1 Tax=Lophiostoma macrostomum CBS 122681 TaxID=1314788 RepID=A0A6A6T228_9PLEO|nr:DUF803-domain-containing protein [Lophiostoma macrostomum CBS 122681]